MDIFDKIQTLQNQNVNEMHKMFEESGKHKKPQFKMISLNVFEDIINQKLEDLDSNDPQIIEQALWNISKCLEINPSLSSLITKDHITKILEMILFINNTPCNEKNQFLSCAFHFLTHFVQCDQSKIPYFLETKDPIDIFQLAISKIPIDSVCDFIVELLKYSEDLEEDNDLNVFNFFIENDLRSKLLNIFVQLKTFCYQQSQVLKILVFLWKNQEITQEELDIFIFESNYFLKYVSNSNTDSQFQDYFNSLNIINYLKFILQINSPLFYSSFSNYTVPKNMLSINKEENNYCLLTFIWNSIKKQGSHYKDICYACFDFLINVINYNEDGEHKNAVYLIENGISHHFSDLLRMRKNESIKMRGAMVIEALIDINPEICEKICNFEYTEMMIEFLHEGQFFQQQIAIRFVSILMKYNTNLSILKLLTVFNPFERIIDFLNGDNYPVICNLLNCIKNDWGIEINSEFLNNVHNLKENEDFVFALNNIETGDDEQSSDLAQCLLQMIGDE